MDNKISEMVNKIKSHIKVSLVGGYYTHCEAYVIHDPHDFQISNRVFVYAMYRSYEAFNAMYENRCENIDIEILEPDQIELYEPGWIFIRASEMRLRSISNSLPIHIRLYTRDNKELHIRVNLKQLGYAMDNLDPTMVCDYLITMPCMPDSTTLWIPDYSYNAVQHMAFDVDPKLIKWAEKNNENWQTLEAQIKYFDEISENKE